MYNILKNSFKPNLLQRATIALSRADQLTAAREYRLHRARGESCTHRGVLYSQGGLDGARRYRTRYFKSPGRIRAGTGTGARAACTNGVTSILVQPKFSTELKFISLYR